MDASDLEFRNLVYRRFVELGRAPSIDELAGEQTRARNDVAASLGRLHDAHAVVLQPESGEILMANPFSAVPTPHRVEAAGRQWYANCAWDAFGIPAALGVDGHVSTSCPDCSAPIELDLRDGRPVPADAVFHVLVPAERWWANIAFT